MPIGGWRGRYMRGSESSVAFRARNRTLKSGMHFHKDPGFDPDSSEAWMSPSVPAGIEGWKMIYIDEVTRFGTMIGRIIRISKIRQEISLALDKKRKG